MQDKTLISKKAHDIYSKIVELLVAEKADLSDAIEAISFSAAHVAMSAERGSLSGYKTLTMQNARSTAYYSIMESLEDGNCPHCGEEVEN